MNDRNRFSILVLIGDYKQKEPIGTAIYSQNFVKSVPDLWLQFDIHILSLSDIDWPWPLGKANLLSRESALFRFYRKLLLAATAATQAATKKPTLVLCLEENLAPLGLLLSKALGTKYAVFAHDPRCWGQVDSQKDLKSADWIVANSARTKQKIVAQLGLPPEKVSVIYPYVDGATFYPTGKSMDLAEKYGIAGRKVIMTVGRMDEKGLESKRQDAVIGVLGKVKEKIPNIAYVIVGPGDQQNLLYRLATDHGVQDSIIFTGSVQGRVLVEYYNLCDVFVMPSQNEGFGMSYIEALACGKPVIGGAGTGADDVLLGGKLGILVDPLDTDSLAQAITGVLVRQVDARLLDSAYLRRSALSHFGINRFRHDLASFMESLNCLCQGHAH